MSVDMLDLGPLVRVLDQLGKVPSRIAAAAADDIEDLIQEEFDAGCDPYGVAWEELKESTKAKGRHAPPLTDTGGMRSGIEVSAMSGQGISITFDDDRAPHPAMDHQYGAPRANLPARPMLPDERGLPPSWLNAIASAHADAFAQATR